MIELLDVPVFFNTIAFILGLCLGSFYNVCVHRYLVGQSVVFPASHCPACGHELSWRENIPVISSGPGNSLRVIVLPFCHSLRLQPFLARVHRFLRYFFGREFH